MEWTLDSGKKIKLYTLEEFEKLPDGTRIVDIFGEVSTKSEKTDKDTRGGYVAYGSVVPTNPFTPVKTIELSSGTAEVYQDGSMMLKRITLNLDEDEAYFVMEEQQFPLSKDDVDKIAAHYIWPGNVLPGLDNSPKP